MKNRNYVGILILVDAQGRVAGGKAFRELEHEVAAWNFNTVIWLKPVGARFRSWVHSRMKVHPFEEQTVISGSEVP